MKNKGTYQQIIDRIITSSMSRKKTVIVWKGTSVGLSLDIKLPRPIMADYALRLIKDGSKIEMRNEYVFAFMRGVENHSEGSIKLNCSINELNKGWTVISK